jgi:hypothetical protein
LFCNSSDVWLFTMHAIHFLFIQRIIKAEKDKKNLKEIRIGFQCTKIKTLINILKEANWVFDYVFNIKRINYKIVCRFKTSLESKKIKNFFELTINFFWWRRFIWSKISFCWKNLLIPISTKMINLNLIATIMY